MRLIDYPGLARDLDGGETFAGWQDGQQRSVQVDTIAGLAAQRAVLAVNPDATAYANWLALPGNGGKSVEEYLDFLTGPAGPAASTFTTLADLKAAPATNKSYTFAPPSGSEGTVVAGSFLFVAGDFTQADDKQNTIGLSATPIATGALVRQGAKNSSYVPPVGPAVSTSGFLDRQGVWAGAATEIQPALDYLANPANASERQPVNLAPGKTIQMPDQGLVIDAAYTFLKANGTILQWEVLSGVNAAAVLIRGSENPPASQGTHVLDRLYLKGPAVDNPDHPGVDFSNTIGIHFDGIMGGEFGPSNIGVRDSLVRGFGKGVRHGHNSYLNRLYGMGITECLVGIETYGSTANTTENIRYVGGAIANNFLAMRQADYGGSGTLFLDGMSLDYNLKIAEINSRAGIVCTACWQEANPYTQEPITFAPGPDGSTDGAFFFFNGGRWLLSSPGTTFDYWANVPAGAVCRIHPDFATRAQTSTNTAFTGDGESSFLWRHSYDAHGNCLRGHTSRYTLPDGNMEAAGVVDQFIYEDTAAGTSSSMGTNLTLTKSTAQAYSGTQSLKFTKVGGGGSPASWAFAVPVQEGELISRNYRYRKPAESTMTGPLFIQARFGVISYDASGNPRIQSIVSNDGDYALNLGAGDTGWQDLGGPGAGIAAARALRGATHAITLLIGFLLSSGDLYFDDIWMGPISCK